MKITLQENEVPKKYPTWEEIKRAPTYLRAAIYMPDPLGGGRVSYKDVNMAYKKTEEQFDTNKNSRANGYTVFWNKWQRWGGNLLQDSHYIEKTVTNYFKQNSNGEVCFNKATDGKPNKVEIKGPNGNWVEIWSR